VKCARFERRATISEAAAVTVAPRVPGDLDGDGDFDLDDVRELLRGFTGPG
jgi:hypothetical protein